jgi:hypothetical protein
MQNATMNHVGPATAQYLARGVCVCVWKGNSEIWLNACVSERVCICVIMCERMFGSPSVVFVGVGVCAAVWLCLRANKCASACVQL